MKHLTYLFALLALVSMAMPGCTNDDPSNNDDPNVKCTFGEVGSNSIDLVLSTSGINEYAYFATSDMSVNPDAATIFKDGIMGKLKNGDNAVKVVDLDPATEYNLFVTTKTGTDYGKVYSTKFTTKSYTSMVTMIEVEDYFSVKFHIEVPKGKNIAYAVVDGEYYRERGEDIGMVDADRLRRCPDSNILTSSKTIEFKGWSYVNETTGEEEFDPIVPSRSIVVIACEVEYKEDPFYGGKSWIPLFDYEKYNNENPKPPVVGAPATRQESEMKEDNYWLTEAHGRAFAFARDAQIASANIEVRVLTHTTRAFSAELIPEAKIVGYGFMFVDMSFWERILKLCGGEQAALTYCTLNGMGGVNGIQTAEFTGDDLQPNTDYRLILLSKLNDTGTIRAVQYYDFKAKDPSKPAPEMIVTALEHNPTPGGVDSPWEVWYNFKSPTKDIETVRLVCQSSQEIVRTVNSLGGDYDMLIKLKGVKYDLPEFIALVNSDAGYNISFSAWEDTLYSLYVQGLNDEDTANSIDPKTAGKGWAEARSIEDPAKTPVSSSLYADLAGEWTATAHIYRPIYDESGNVTWEIDAEPTVSKVSIGESGLEYVSPCPQSTYDVYKKLGHTKEEVDQFYAQFVASHDKYLRKVHSWNRLSCHGLDFADLAITRYVSPWFLFNLAEGYSSYTTDDMYYDFGPKWYLEIAEGDQVTLPIDYENVAPLMPYNGVTDAVMHLLAANPAKGYDKDIKSFKMKISDDKKRMELQPVGPSGSEFYLTIGINNGDGSIETYAMLHDLVLTKGWNNSNSVAPYRNLVKAPAQMKSVKMNAINGTYPKYKVNRMTNLTMNRTAADDVNASKMSHDR